MPRYNLPIEEIDEAIRRPMISTITTDLMALFGLDTGLNMVFKGDAPQHTYKNSEINGAGATDGNNRYAGEGLLTIVDYEDQLNETTLLSTPVDYPDSKGIFFDNELKVYMVPVRISRKFEIRLQLTGTEKQIERWGAMIKKKTANGLLNGLHAVKYHYPIPKHYMGLLVEIYNRRQKIAPYEDDLGTWLKKCFIPTMGVIRDLNGQNPTFVIQETQLEVQGWFDFGTGVPKKEEEGDTGRYALNFSYTFYADIPETINMMTPLLIHNQLIPAEWFPQPAPMAELDFIKKNGSYSQEAFDHFRFGKFGTEYTWSATRPGLSIPTMDDWVGDEQPAGYGSIMRLLSKLDPCKPNTVHNIGELGEWAIDPTCLHYMLDTRPYITVPYDNVINLQVYRYDNLLHQFETHLEDDLTVTVEDPVDMRQMYHCVIGMSYDPQSLTTQARIDLARHGCFFKKLISALYPFAPAYYGWDLNSCTVGFEGDTMTPGDIDDIIDEVTNSNNGKPLWALVGFFTVLAERKDDLNVTD